MKRDERDDLALAVAKFYDSVKVRLQSLEVLPLSGLSHNTSSSDPASLSKMFLIDIQKLMKRALVIFYSTTDA